jgi:dienelactone hydrolase
MTTVCAPSLTQAVCLTGPRDDGRSGIFGMLHPPAPGTARDTAVLLLPPWGWEEVASHRSRRAWANALARSGHPTLRIDLPGTGDSAGSPGDDGCVDRWTSAIDRAGAWLRTTGGCRRLAVIGLGVSGLLALRSVGQGAEVDDLVLWACPPTGRAFVRRVRATSLMEGTAGDERSDGALVAGGFLLSASTLASLAALQPRVPAGSALERVLVLEQEGAGPARLPDVPGATVTVAPGAGWSKLVGSPETSVAPAQVVAGVIDWLAERSFTGEDGAAVAPADRLELRERGRRLHELPFWTAGTRGRLAGVLTTPAEPSGTDVCGVFLNAGAVRRIGPNRLWVEAARRWAGRGVPSLRLDLHGIGEADGRLDVERREARLPAAFYAPEAAAQVNAALDALIAAGAGRRFVLVGLCAGGHWAFQRAQDERVCAVVALNPGALAWDPHARGRRELRRLRRLGDPSWWAKLAHGGVDLRSERLLTAGAAVVPRRQTFVTTQTTGVLDRLREQDTPLILAFSGDEPLREDLARDGLLGRLHRWPRVTLETLPGTDHTLRSPSAQAAAHTLIDRGLALAQP